jgi:hypothetical protein
MNKEERALEALLTLAFRTELTNEEINEFFSKPVQLSKEDEEMIKNWKIDINEIIKKPSSHNLENNHLISLLI